MFWRVKNLASSQMIEFYKNLTKEFPIISLEDPLAEEDWEGFKEITKKCRGNDNCC